MKGVEKAAWTGTLALLAVGAAVLVAESFGQHVAIPAWVIDLLPAVIRPATIIENAAVSAGQQIFAQKGCGACHSTDGSPNVGPTLKGLYGRTVEFNDGSTAKVDDAFLVEFIRRPRNRPIKGFQPVMPDTDLTGEQLRQLVAYLKSLS